MSKYGEISVSYFLKLVWVSSNMCHASHCKNKALCACEIRKKIETFED